MVPREPATGTYYMCMCGGMCPVRPSIGKVTESNLISSHVHHAGTTPLVAYEGPRTAAEAARLCGLAADEDEHGEGEEGASGGIESHQSQGRQQRRAAL